MLDATMRWMAAAVAATALGGVAQAQVNQANVPYVNVATTIDGVLSPGEWTGALVIAVEGSTPTTNPGWNPYDGQSITPADCSYNLHLKHDSVYFYVAFDVTDDSVSDDYTAPPRPAHTEVWNDDCTEVFIDGDLDRDATEGAGTASPVGDRDWREGQQPHFGTRANSYWENNVGYKDRIWWAATTLRPGGYITEWRFAFRGIDTANGEANFEPLKTGQTIGFSALVNDDDNGGDREDQLAWIGGGTDDSLYRSQQNWGYATMMPPPGYVETGIPTRAENEALLIDAVPNDNPGAMVVERVFSQLAFERPVLLIESPDASGRLFVVEQRGRIKTFVKSTNPAPGNVTTFLDIVDRTRSVLDGGELEEGLLGLAFDPDYDQNGEFYVNYITRANPRRTRISRFTANPPGAATVNAASEEILLEFDQPEATHKGGMMAFGFDGMLYIGSGDGGGVGDSAGAGNNAQNTTNLLGSFLRIDPRGTPDPGLAYRIPPDNPFYSSGPAGTSTRKEIYAYGFRNPWRWSIDAQTGAIIIGDVGQGEWEEINVLKPGANYGWRIMEGPNCYNAPSCNTAGLTPPIAVYSHDFGFAVTGGFVYYGSEVPALYGKYLYGDYVTGRLWSLTYDPVTDTHTPPVEIGDLSGFELGAFGQDASGEVYLLNLTNGAIYVLRPGSGGSPAQAVTTNPDPPVQSQNVTITYNANGRVLDGQPNVNIYRGQNGWAGVTQNAMTNAGANTWTYTFSVPNGATVLNMVFNNGAGTWDNNEGANWNITTDGPPAPVTVSTAPAPPIRGQSVTITYDSTGRNIQGAANVNIHRGYNGWAAGTVTTNAMTNIGNNKHTYTFTVPGTANVLDMVFNNGAGTWDNNGGADWHINTAAASLPRLLADACDGTLPFPTRLSDIPALLDAGLGLDQVNLGIIPYEPSAKLWSDNTAKSRFIALPDLAEVGYVANNGWDFPEDTVLIKNFVLPLDERNPASSGKRIETRLMIRNCDEWFGFSYEWNDAQTDATLLTTAKTRPFTIIDENGAPFAYDWHYPSRDQCSVCHTNAANNVLGLTTAALNFEMLYPRTGHTRNQLETLDYISLFGEPGLPAPAASLPKMPDPANTNAPIRDRARAYLAANCAHCHQPGGGGGGAFDLRWHIADQDTGLIDVAPGNTLGIPNARLIAPGDPSRSVVYQRMITTSVARMPPLATSRVDEEGTAVIQAWINSLAPANGGSNMRVY